MAKLFIERKAGENKYLHRDFFVSGDIGISFVGENYGDEGVKEYLACYAESFYKPLAQAVIEKGLIELKNYFTDIYKKEEWEQYLHARIDGDVLTITVDKCPAVTFMKASGHTPSRWYKETTYTVYGTLAKMCGLDFEVKYYDEKDGKTEFTFGTITGRNSK